MTELETRKKDPERLVIVGIGASAGGLEAFERFLRPVQPDSGLAYVLVQHLDPQHESLLADLLGRVASIPVTQVIDGQPVQANQVYVVPPSASLFIDEGRLRLAPMEPRATRMPINAFFTSLAEDQRENAVGIVLSGAGSDGALGLKAIKQHGGMTFVQDPRDARYDSMPREALSAGGVDRVLSVEEMPEVLVGLRRERLTNPHTTSSSELEGLSEAFSILRRVTGHDFSRYKRSTVLRRLHRRMGLTGAASVREYASRMEHSSEEVKRLFEDLMINVTEFFREPDAYKIIEERAVPDLLAHADSEGIRIWSPGCSTGEEPFSLAMLLREQMDQMEKPPRVQIFATDIDPAALATARLGRYSEAAAVQVSPRRLDRFFTKQGNAYTICKEVRDLVLFTGHDLLKDPPFSRIDLLTCRNLLIYLEPELQKRAFETFHYSLRKGGYLFLGRAEVVDPRDQDLFEVVDKQERVFRRREVDRPVSHRMFPREYRSMPLFSAPSTRSCRPPRRSCSRSTRSSTPSTPS